jgi:hypothetical protein
MAQQPQQKDDPSRLTDQAAAWLEWQREYSSKASFQMFFIWHRYARQQIGLAARAKGER